MSYKKITPTSYMTHGTVYSTSSIDALFDGLTGISPSSSSTETKKGLIVNNGSNIGFISVDLGDKYQSIKLILKAYLGDVAWSTMTIKNFKVQGNNKSLKSTEGWEDIFVGTTSSKNGIDEYFFENKSEYQYIRIYSVDNWGYANYTSMSEIEFYVSRKKTLLKSNNKIYSLKSHEILHETKMTSNTAPAPFVASASSEYSSTYSAWKAFNGDFTTDNYWCTTTAKNNSWLMIKLDKETQFNKVVLKSMIERKVGYNPKEFKIQASNDGINFTDLAYVNENWNTMTDKVVRFSNINKYLYYRIFVINNNGASYTGIREIFFYKPSIIQELTSTNKSCFLSYGMNSPIEIDEIFTNKNYILQDTVSEDTDGLWTTKINRKPLSIKFE